MSLAARRIAALLALAAAVLPPSFAEVRADDWPMFGGRPDRNMVSGEKKLPSTWSANPKKNVKWVAELGNQTYGTPVVAGGRVYIGTNNGKPRNPAVTEDRGVLMCFAEADGKFLWQALHEKLPTGDAEDFPKIGICSTPCVAGDRVYYVSNRGELVCCDALGFSDGENDGPFGAERLTGKEDADFIWLLDMPKELGVSPHQASASSPVVVGDLVFVLTGQGADTETHKVKNPKAPSFIAVDRHTGKVAWRDGSPGDRILAAQWASPAYGVVDGRPQVAFPGGDGWLYAFEPATGRLLWKFNCKAHEKITPEGKPETDNQLVATPVYAGHRVLIATGIDTETSGKPGCLRAIDARRSGDITRDGELWRLADEEFGRSISTVAVQEGLVYAVELDGYVNCLELESGRRVWKHDLLSTVWGSALAADGKVYVQTGDGDVTVLAAGREKKVLGKNTLPSLAHGTAVAANGVLYLTGEKQLYAVAE